MWVETRKKCNGINLLKLFITWQIDQYCISRWGHFNEYKWHFDQMGGFLEWVWEMTLACMDFCQRKHFFCFIFINDKRLRDVPQPKWASILVLICDWALSNAWSTLQITFNNSWAAFSFEQVKNTHSCNSFLVSHWNFIFFELFETESRHNIKKGILERRATAIFQISQVYCAKNIVSRDGNFNYLFSWWRLIFGMLMC